MKARVKTQSVLLLFFVSSIVVLVVSVAASRLMISSAQMIADSTEREMTALSEAVSTMASGEALDAFQAPADMETAAYRALREQLHAFAERADILYAYYMRLDPDTDQMQFIVDNVLDPSAGIQDGLDSPQVPREAGSDLALTGIAHTEELGTYSVGWDGLLTAWAPVYYSDGSLSNMVAGVDKVDVNIQAARRNTYMFSIVLLVAMVIVLSSCITCLLLYQKKADQANTASEAKSSFLSRMSHEMRTPMNAIIGLSRMALASDDLQEVRGYLGNIEVSSEHLRHVIDDVLDISRIESGKLVLDIIPVNVREAMDRLARIIRPQAEAKRQVFLVHTAEDVPQEIYCDATRLQQVLVNLLGNAVKFTPEGGTVRLTLLMVDRQDGRAKLSWRIQDNGIGISEEQLARIFTPFEQADVSTTRQYGGSGLGLAIAQKLTTTMGGDLRVQSEVGKGSDFTVDFWLNVAEQPVAAAKDAGAAADAPLDLTSRHILLVEDAEMNRMIAANLFEGFGATVAEAVNGQEGVDMFAANPGLYDMVFMDIQMPVMDGYAAAQAIRAMGGQGGRVPIVAMTANVFKEDVEKAIAAGMNGHVGKPFDVAMIEAAIRQNLPDLAGRPDAP